MLRTRTILPGIILIKTLREIKHLCYTNSMIYERIEEAIFKSRPNRFIAQVETSRGIEICHVKNTGRCRELLVPEAKIWVQRNENPNRKTALDLIVVDKAGTIINMDSQIPNRVAEEWIRGGGLARAGQASAVKGWAADVVECFDMTTSIRPETRYGNSRFDFYLEQGEHRLFLEVKGVTLEEDGVARFPDAPTERGVKHVEELIHCMEDGYEAGILFVIQMKGIRYLEPNDRTHPAFGEALRRAEKAGVQVLAVDCQVTPESIRADQMVEVRL